MTADVLCRDSLQARLYLGFVVLPLPGVKVSPQLTTKIDGIGFTKFGNRNLLFLLRRFLLFLKIKCQFITSAVSSF